MTSDSRTHPAARAARFIARVICWAMIAVFGSAVVIIGGYLAGWVSWSPAAERAPEDIPETQALRLSDQPFSILTARQRAGSEPASVRGIISDARATVRYGLNRDDAAARAYGILRDIPDRELGKAFEAACRDCRGNAARDDIVIRLLLDRWAKVDPLAAFEAPFDHIKSATEAMRRDIVMDLSRTPLLKLAAKDPEGAFAAWRQRLAPLDVDYDDAARFPLGGIFLRWAGRDFDAALDTALRLEPEYQSYAARGLAEAAFADPDRLVAALESAGAEHAVAEARKTIVKRHLAAGSPAVAAEWIDRQTLRSETRAMLENELAREWIWIDPHAAAAWVVSRADDTNRSERIRLAVERWSEWEPNEAGAWLSQMMGQHEGDADAAAGAFAQNISAHDPAAALAWIAAIRDDEARRNAAANLGRHLKMRLGQDDAAGIIATSPLAEADRHAVREGMR